MKIGIKNLIKFRRGQTDIAAIMLGDTMLFGRRPVETFSVTTDVTNGEYSGATTIQTYGTASVTITPNPDYVLPQAVTITGATLFSYDRTTGVITFRNPTENVTITVICAEMTALAAPTISLIDSNTLNIFDNDGNATSFDIYVDGVYAVNVAKSQSGGTLTDLTNTNWVLNAGFQAISSRSIGTGVNYDIETNIGNVLKKTQTTGGEHMATKTATTTLTIGSTVIARYTSSRDYVAPPFPEDLDRQYYGIISITGGTHVTDSTLIDWFQNNATQIQTTFDLSTLGLSSGTHAITAKAKADYYYDSQLSNSVSYTVA